MTQAEYGTAYEKGYKTTLRFLASRGIPLSSAEDTAQAAWVKGWERVAQLRNPQMVVTWVNSIALNIYRTYLRQPPLCQINGQLPEVNTAPCINLAALEIRRLLRASKGTDRLVLTRHYLEGYSMEEIAHAHGWTVMAVRIRMLRARRKVAAKFAA